MMMMIIYAEVPWLVDTVLGTWFPVPIIITVVLTYTSKDQVLGIITIGMITVGTVGIMGIAISPLHELRSALLAEPRERNSSVASFDSLLIYFPRYHSELKRSSGSIRLTPPPNIFSTNLDYLQCTHVCVHGCGCRSSTGCLGCWVCWEVGFSRRKNLTKVSAKCVSVNIAGKVCTYGIQC